MGNDELMRTVNRDVTNRRAAGRDSSSRGHKGRGGHKGKGKGRTDGGEGKSAGTDKAQSK